MSERLSYTDSSVIRGFGIHIQRYEFALEHCLGAKVLDAGCGIGYGSAFLASNGAKHVTGVDISEHALEEARSLYTLPNLEFVRDDVQQLESSNDLRHAYDCIVNLENLEHLRDPDAFLQRTVELLRIQGTLVCSTPNGELTERDDQGRITNPYHVREFTPQEFKNKLGRFFGNVSLFGQWQTHAGKARLESARHMFEQLSEMYYNPVVRAGRLIKRVLGKTCACPPEFTAAGESYPWEYIILPVHESLLPWKPAYLIAVCSSPV